MQREDSSSSGRAKATIGRLTPKDDAEVFERGGPEAVRDRDAELEVVQVEPAADEAGDGEQGKGPPLRDVVIELAREEGIGLFRTSDDEVFCDIWTPNGVRATWPVRSSRFTAWVRALAWRRLERGLSATTIGEIADTLLGCALDEAEVRDVHLRIGEERGGELWIDLADDTWRAVRVTPDGWSVEDAPPVRFRRPGPMRPLPVPERGGDVEELRQVVHVASDADWTLIRAWLLCALGGASPYPILALTGEQGSGKSQTARFLRSLVDPRNPPDRGMVRDERDIKASVQSGHVLAFDNLSAIPCWLSDTLCRIATGAGFEGRRLFTDTETSVVYGARPIVLTSITDVATRSDLADRALAVRLEPIADAQRKTEAELNATRDAMRPRLFGALLDALARGLRRRGEARAPRKPRMADAFAWASACGDGELWTAEDLERAWFGAREGLYRKALDAEPVALAIVDLMEGRASWQGTASDLLEALNRQRGDNPAPGGWPATASTLAKRRDRLAPLLRNERIQWSNGGREPGGIRRRLHRLTRGE